MTDKTPYLTAENRSVKAQSWLAALGGPRKRWRTFQWEHTALLVLDMQRYFLSPASPAHMPAATAILPTVARVTSEFHAHGQPVVLTYVGVREGESDPLGRFWGRTIRDGTVMCQIASELLRNEPDTIVRKRGYSAFSGTALGGTLQHWGVESIVIAGVATNLCCEATARDGFDRGFNVFVLADATAAANEDLHMTSLQALCYACATPLLSHDL